MHMVATIYADVRRHEIENLDKNMRKTKATKKSGTIAYQLNPRFDLQGEATEKNPLMGVSIVPTTPVTTKEMAERIGYATSVNKTDVVAVLSALGHELSRALLDGRTVQVDEIGSFNVKLGLKERKYLDDRVTHHDIEVKGISFRPCKELKEAMPCAPCSPARLPRSAFAPSLRTIPTSTAHRWRPSASAPPTSPRSTSTCSSRRAASVPSVARTAASMHRHRKVSEE